MNGEMFKDARLQERILDQIHAREFNIEDDSRTAEVGSVLPASFATGSFQRVDDGDTLSAPDVPQRQARKPVAARLDSFTDEGLETLSIDSSFQRVSDDEEGAFASGQDDETEAEPTEASEKKKRSSRRPAAAKASKKKAPTRKSSAAKKPPKRAADSEADDSIPTEHLTDAEASISSGPSLAEFATRRGGRRRRRPGGKPKTEGEPRPHLLMDRSLSRKCSRRQSMSPYKSIRSYPNRWP